MSVASPGWTGPADARGCVIDERGARRASSDRPRCRRLAELCAGCAVRRRAVAIERPSGLLVDALVEAGFTVVPIHPNAVKATRPRYRSHGGKSDAGDAYLLADLLRTDGHRFKPLTPQSDEIRALRALVRGRDDLVATRVQLANQLRSLLESFWPGAAEVFADVDSPIALAFIQRYPTPEAAQRLGPKRMAAFCAQHAYCGRRSAEDCWRGCTKPPRHLRRLETEAKGELRSRLARTLAAPGRADPAARPAASSTTSPRIDDGRILMSFPRAGRICAAQILAELGSVRERFDSATSTSPPRPASHPSPTSPASPRPSPSAGPATTGCAPPHLPRRQLPPRQRLGRQLYAKAAPAAATIHTPSASSRALGCA